MGVGAMGGGLATRGRERGALLFAAGTVVGVEKFTRCARLQLPSFVIGERYAYVILESVTVSALAVNRRRHGWTAPNPG